MPEAADCMIDYVLRGFQLATRNQRQDENALRRHVHFHAWRIFAAPVVHDDTYDRAALVAVDSVILSHRKEAGRRLLKSPTRVVMARHQAQ